MVTKLLEGWRFMIELEMNGEQFVKKDLHWKVQTLPVDNWVTYARAIAFGAVNQLG